MSCNNPFYPFLKLSTYIVICLFVIICTQANGQSNSLDSLNQKFEKQQKEILHLQNIMVKHHHVYTNGIAFQVAGLIVLSTALIAPSYAKISIPVGVLLTGVGSIVVISSHMGFSKAKGEKVIHQ